MQAQGGVWVSTFSHTQQKHSPVVKFFASITIQTPVHHTERAGHQRPCHQLTHLRQHQEEGQTQEIS